MHIISRILLSIHIDPYIPRFLILPFISSPFVWSPIPLFLISPNCSVILRISSLYGKIFEASFVSRRLVKVGEEFASPVRAGFVYSNTALRKEEGCINTRWGKECVQACPKFLIASPTFHGGRGALPSAGGHPADLTFLAGGGC